MIERDEEAMTEQAVEAADAILECQRCGAAFEMVFKDAGNRKHALYFGAMGSYDEFVDCVMGPPEVLVLCHDCGHRLMAEWFPSVDVSGWHSHGDAS